MIHIFQRHCNFSSNSVGKLRPDWFSRENCFNNLLLTIKDREDVKLTVMFDGFPSDDHFITKYEGLEMISMKGGDDARSFLNVLNYVKDLQLENDDIVYLLEDDYMHVPGWVDIMYEGFNSTNVEYLTLYDHKDKYFLKGYDTLQSSILATNSTHWRTTPSTTNTYACRFKTLIKHIDIHIEYCDLSRGFTRDHDKFIRLWQEGSNLISSLPGYSTHVETPYLSPVVDWDKISYIK